MEVGARGQGSRRVRGRGHSECGALLGTLEELLQPSENQSRNLRSIVDRVRPSVEAMLQTDLKGDLGSRVEHAVRANVDVSVNQLRQGSEILEELIKTDGLVIVGAEYSLTTGEVEFYCDA